MADIELLSNLDKGKFSSNEQETDVYVYVGGVFLYF